MGTWPYNQIAVKIKGRDPDKTSTIGGKRSSGGKRSMAQNMDTRYNKCQSLLQSLIDEYTASMAESEDTSDTIRIEDIWNCIYANNMIVCEALELVTNTTVKECERLLSKFRKNFELHKFISGIPTQLRYTLLHNFLYWYWLKYPCFQSTCQNNAINATNECLVDMLHTRCDGFIENNLLFNGHTELLHVLGRLANLTLRSVPIESLQIIDIIHVCMLLLLEFPLDNLGNDFKCLIDSFVQCIDQLEFHFKSAFEASVIKISSKMGYFKLGFKQINAQLDMKYYRVSMMAFCLTIVLLYIKMNLYKDAMGVLDKAETFNCDGEFCVLYFYVKAYVCCKVERYAESTQLLNSIFKMEVDDFLKAKIYILRGIVNSKQKRHFEAIEEFKKVLSETNSCRETATYYISCENEALDLRTSQILCLHQIVENLKNPETCNKITTTEIIGFETRYIKLLHPQPEFTIIDSLYAAANTNLKLDHFGVSATMYNDLLKNLKSGVRTSGSIIKLPTERCIFHEVILVNFKHGNYESAEDLAKNVIRNYVPHYNDSIIRPWRNTFHDSTRPSPTDWYYCLYHFEDDVIALLLLSDIYQAQQDYQQQMEILNRCYNAILSYINIRIPSVTNVSTQAKRSKRESESSLSLCKLLVSKMLLRKAHLCSKLGMKDECDQCFSRALKYNPCDSDIIYYYKSWLLSEKREQESSEIVASGEEISLPVEEYPDFTLTYLLKSGISDDSICEFRNIVDDMEEDEDLLAALYED